MHQGHYRVALDVTKSSHRKKIKETARTEKYLSFFFYMQNQMPLLASFFLP